MVISDNLYQDYRVIMRDLLFSLFPLSLTNFT